MDNTSFHMVHFEDLEANELTCHSPSVSSTSSFDFNPLDFAPQHFPPLNVTPLAIPNSPDCSSGSFCLSSSRLLCMEEDDEDVDPEVSVSSFSFADTESTHSGLSDADLASGATSRVSKKKVMSAFFRKVWQSVKHTFLCSHGMRVEPLDEDAPKPVLETREFISDLLKEVTLEEEKYSVMAHEWPHSRLIFVKPVEQVDATDRMSICTSPFSSACSDDEVYSSQPLTDANTDSTQSLYCSSP